LFLFVRGFDHVYVGVDYFAKTIVFLYKSVKAIELITFLKDDFILFYFILIDLLICSNVD